MLSRFGGSCRRRCLVGSSSCRGCASLGLGRSGLQLLPRQSGQGTLRLQRYAVPMTSADFYETPNTPVVRLLSTARPLLSGSLSGVAAETGEGVSTDDAAMHSRDVPRETPVKAPRGELPEDRDALLANLSSIFWSRPLPERLAAATVARFMMVGSPTADGGIPRFGVQPLPPCAMPDEDDTTTAMYGAMPLRLFVERIPSVTRDAIFQSCQDPLTYLRTTASDLLELVFQHGDGTVSTQETPLRPAPGVSSPLQPTEGDGAPQYGSVAFVRVRGGTRAAAAIVEFVEDRKDVSPPTLSRSPCDHAKSVTDESHSLLRDNEAASDDGDETTPLTAEQVDALLDTLVAVLRKREELVKPRYMAIGEAYLAVMREAARHPGDTARHWLAHHLTRDQFSELLVSSSASPPADSEEEAAAPAATPSVVQEKVRAAVWVVHGSYVAVRKPAEDGDRPPLFTNPQPRVKHAGSDNNFGGWGAADAVPTRQDVYEILKYVPVNWGNLGNMNIPTAIRKKHMRTSSPLQWFRRQPYYFEVRNMNGTIEIRRSCVLHPEAHGLTREEASERLELAIASGEANCLTVLGPNGAPLEEEMTTAEKAIHKFFLRVCPPYFAPLSLVMQRYTKKNLTEAVLLAMARRRPTEFEILQPRYVDVPLVRKRVGADSRRWRDAFVADMEKHPEDVRGILMIMNRLCPSWDRPEYVYVRLTPQEQRAMGGYDAMMTILRRHPEIFRVGENFVCRVDSSDPFAAQEAEPSVHDLTSRTYLREENPYLSPIDLALVFHYAAPADEPCTATFLVDCASPAMRVALPPRVVTIVQQFPSMFACKETAPGVFSIRKVVARQTSLQGSRSTPGATSSTMAATTPLGQREAGDAVGAAEGEAAVLGDSDDGAWMELEAELAEEEHLSKAQLLAAVLELIPHSGVEGSQLLLWASMQIQHAANHYYGGLLKMVDVEKAHFHVTDTPEGKMVRRREALGDSSEAK